MLFIALTQQMFIENVLFLGTQGVHGVLTKNCLVYLLLPYTFYV